MFKTKWFLLVFSLALVITGCSKQTKENDGLLKDTLSASGNTHYKTTQVMTGDFIKQVAYPAEAVFPDVRLLSFQSQGFDVVFNKYLVKVSDVVKKGTPLANFSIINDPITLEEKELQLKREKESYKDDLATREAEIKRAEIELKTMVEDIDKEIGKIKLEKLRNDYESYKFTSENNLNKQEKDLNDYKSKLAKTQLISPIDGQIAEKENLDTGEHINQDDPLIAIYSPDEMLLQVNDEMKLLRYNMEVTIEAQSRYGKFELKGRVLSCPSILSDDTSEGIALIKVTDKIDVNYNNVRKSMVTVKADVIKNSKVLLVDKTAVYTDDLGTFVMILDKGVTHKHYFVSGDQNADYYWILQGLEEGQTVIMK